MKKLGSLILMVFSLLLILVQCRQEKRTEEGEFQARQFLEIYTDSFLHFYTSYKNAEWRSAINYDPKDTVILGELERAKNAFAGFTGSAYHIKTAQKLLKEKSFLSDSERRQLKRILYFAGNNPWNVKEIVRQRINKEIFQNQLLLGFEYSMNQNPVTLGEIDEALVELTDPEERLKWWEVSKKPGPLLSGTMMQLRNMRNGSVKGMDYKNYFQYKVTEYGMSESEMMTLLEQLISKIWPLYREIHTWARYELAEKYGAEEVPDMIPAHWLPDRWGKDWSAILEPGEKEKDLSSAETSGMVEEEEFFESIGWDPLPSGFYENSDFSRSPHGQDPRSSAWHMNLEDDVRVFMNIVPGDKNDQMIYRKLGQVYYFLSYSRDEVPVLLRAAANRSFPHAIGSLVGFAAGQSSFSEGKERGIKSDSVDFYRQLLREALDYVVFIPFSAGVMTHFEYTLYNTSIDTSGFNAEWWKLKKKYQGIDPPYERGNKYNDAAPNYFMMDHPAEYYDLALSSVLLFQLHSHISHDILGVDPHIADYYGHEDIGRFLKSMMEPGADYDGLEWLRENLGNGFSADAMDEYFKPLTEYLKKQNEGRKYTLPVRIL